MTGKDRATLRRAANGLETIYQVGKDGVDDILARGVEQAVKARELVKLRVLDNCPLSAREAATNLAERMGADIVQVIGSRFVLYRRNKDINQYGI